MQSYRGFYKARFGAYRVGMTVDNDTLILQVVMDRKDIYKFFP
jgi:mRNA-degrading endonuclease RelE of RelBE toxin-antitoxin system